MQTLTLFVGFSCVCGSRKRFVFTFHELPPVRCVSLWEGVFSEGAGSTGQPDIITCSFLIALILVLALSSLSLFLPTHSFPVPTATRGFQLHNSGACGMFLHVYVHVSVTPPPGLWKSNTAFSVPVSLQALVSALLIAMSTVILLACVCMCVSTRVLFKMQLEKINKKMCDENEKEICLHRNMSCVPAAVETQRLMK